MRSISVSVFFVLICLCHTQADAQEEKKVISENSESKADSSGDAQHRDRQDKRKDRKEARTLQNRASIEAERKVKNRLERNTSGQEATEQELSEQELSEQELSEQEISEQDLSEQEPREQKKREQQSEEQQQTDQAPKARQPSEAYADEQNSETNRIQSEETSQAQENQSPPAPVRPPIQNRGSFIGNSTLPPEPIKIDLSNSYDRQKDKNDFEPNELLVSSDTMSSAVETAQDLSAFGLQVKARSSLPQIGIVLTRFRLPDEKNAVEILRLIQQQFPKITIALNHRYRLMSKQRQQWAHSKIQWPASNSNCLAKLNTAIGVIDTSVDAGHPAFEQRKLVTQNFSDGEPASTLHGNAVASLLIGREDKGYRGLIPNAQLYAANVFRKQGKIQDTNTTSLLAALNWLASLRVDIINMSIGGAENKIFNQALQSLLAKDVVLVAAAGNNGPEAEPVYPAALTGVIAVSAVDANDSIYTSANHGDYIDFSAPGVQVWAANDISSRNTVDKTKSAVAGQYHSGTSFAAPFVTAALALERRLEVLQKHSVDLGPKGKDPIYGWGLIKVASLCEHGGTP